MKLDKIKFATLCVLLQGWFDGEKRLLSRYDIEELDGLIDVEVPVPAPIHPSDIENLMQLMKEGTRKIEAIRLHRQMTGFGLKESKDAVERYWVSKVPTGE